jgi:hypothetical protein
MSSTPKCLQNPTLRRVSTSWGAVVLERIKPKDYVIWKDGVRLGRVHYTHPAGWLAEGERGHHSTRTLAISAAITAWYCRAKARSA